MTKERHKAYPGKHVIQKLYYATKDNPFSGRVICGQCGRAYGRKTWTLPDKITKRIVWQCNNKYIGKGVKGCTSKHIDDRVLYQAFVDTYNSIIENKDYFMEKWKEELQSENVLVRYKAKQFIMIMDKAKPIKEFDMDLFFRIVEKMTVFDGGRLIVSLLDGTDIECVIE